MSSGDICDELAGVYPKWFYWPGWHPNDMCYTIPIVMSDDEFYSGKGEVINDIPLNLKYWIFNHTEYINKAKTKGTLPYWISGNEVIFDSLNTKMALRNSNVLGLHDISTKDSFYIINNINELNSKISLFPKGTKVVFDKTMNDGTLMK